MRRFAVTIVGAFAFATATSAAAGTASDSPLHLVVNGRAFGGTMPSGIVRGGVAYVDVVRGVRALGGLLTFGKHGAFRVTAAGRTLEFEAGRKNAILDAMDVRLPGAPFAVDGDIFVPLATVATLAEAKLTLDPSRHRASIALGRGDGFPAADGRSAGGEDVVPSPTQALRFDTTGSTDATGLHARVVITNLTGAPYVLHFPSAKQIAFVVSRNGSEVWTSTADVEGSEPTNLTLPAHASTSVVRDAPEFDRFGAGRYLLRVRLVTAIPIDITPISLGVIDAPQATPGR